MLGWEFPPFISGGLGTACYGLTRAMGQLGTEIVFVLPHSVKSTFSTHVRLMGAQLGCQSPSTIQCEPEELSNVTFRSIDAEIYPYAQHAQEITAVGQVGMPSAQSTTHHGHSAPILEGTSVRANHMQAGSGDNYTGDLFEQINRYAESVCRIARQEQFEIIHAHDWMTYQAGAEVARLSKKPLVVHVHSTEFDRNGQFVDQRIYDIEHMGMHVSERVIAVSNFTKRICMKHYAVPCQKVQVVHNAVNELGNKSNHSSTKKGDKVVLFLGRLTMQKGPQYFVAVARKVLEKLENVKFIMAGSGNLLTETIELAARMGIGHKVLFAGFLQGPDVSRVFRMADVYVMPSVSEPFGIAPLEAIGHDVPAIISKQSGVSEVLEHVLKVDFWDIDEMANKIIALLKHPALHQALRRNGALEVRKLSWIGAARKCVDIYDVAINQSRNCA